MQVLSMLVLLVLWMAGIQGLRLPRQAVILSEDEIDNISDSSSDLKFGSGQSDAAGKGSEFFPFQDSRIYGMNIGLHFILDDINRRIALGSRVHLESLIKVLVLTHGIEKVGGTINESNALALKQASALYPAALRKAINS